MADVSKILDGFYKNIPISITESSVNGGKKVSIKQFPNKDTQSVEELGLIPRKISLTIVINDKIDRDYFSYRNALLAALESKDSGILIHPLYGRIEDMVAVQFSLNESLGSFGSATVSVDFEPNKNIGIPQNSGNVVTQIGTANDAVQSAVQSDISDNFKVTNSFTGNFSDAVDKITSVLQTTLSATAFSGEEAQNANEFAANLSGLFDDVNSLVSSPEDLASSIIGLLTDASGLYDSPDATFNVFTGYFGFGNTDIEIPQNTAGRVERKSNNDTINSAINTSSLSQAYFASVQIDYKTTREVDVITDRLDAQFNEVIEGKPNQAVRDSITSMRAQTLSALSDIRVKTSQIISVETAPTSTRLLAFSYYGNDDSGQDIADLNNISDASFIEGEVEILTS